MSTAVDEAADPKSPSAPLPAGADAGGVRPRRRMATKPSEAAAAKAVPASKRTTSRAAQPDAPVVQTAESAASPKPVKASKAPKASSPAPVSVVAKDAKTEKVAKPAKADKVTKADKPEKAEKAAKASKRQPPLVRDSFTMPADDFALVGTLKARALAAQHVAKKSELLRAGLHALQAMSADQLLATLRTLQPIKLGRPKK